MGYSNLAISANSTFYVRTQISEDGQYGLQIDLGFGR